MSSHRNWLRPRWYVTPMGPESFGSPWPDAVMAISDDEPDPICTRCGAGCPHGGYDMPDGYLCEPCHDVSHPGPVRLSLLDRIDAKLDNLYFSYAARFGKREYR